MLLGTLLTLLVVTLESAGLLETIEEQLYDWRALHFQHYAKAPTDKLFHLEITDGDLDTIGTWPWPRSVWGQIVDELRLSGARAIGLDVLFDKPQRRVFEAQGNLPLAPGVDQDEALGEAIARTPRVVAAASLPWKRAGPEPHGRKELMDLLVGDLQIRPEQALAALLERRVPAEDAKARVDEDFIALRKAAMRSRLRVAMIVDDPGLEELQRVLLPAAAAAGGNGTGNSLLPVLKEQYEQVRVLRDSSLRLARSPEPDVPPPIEGGDGFLPVYPITRHLRGIGFVDYVVPSDDAVVRSVPLWAVHGNRLLPQFGLAVACAMLDVSPADVRLEAGRVVIPAGGSRGEIAVPVYTEAFDDFGRVGFMMDVPWLGNTRWDTVYDFPAHATPKRHLPVGNVWSAVLARGSIEKNDRQLDALVLRIKAAVREDTSKPPLPPVGDPAREPEALQWADVGDGIGEDDADAAKAAKAVRQLVKAQQKLRVRLDELRQAVEGRAVLIGWAATGNVDFYPTSIHARCPGVIVHGLVFNAIMTGEFWRRPPAWVPPLVTFGIGLAATLLVAGLKPLRAMCAVVALTLAYAAVNAVLLFDRGNLLLNTAGPLVAAGFVWSGVTLLGFVNEVWERTRITERFRSYVDPSLVNYVLDNPDLPVFEGHDQDMTVVFTDLQGFTGLSEVLRNDVVPLLRSYMEIMVPAIRERNGLVNKFLGDGIMFFFGAPQENPRHAENAMDTVLELQRLLEAFKVSLRAEDRLSDKQLDALQMRAGVSSGKMYVGDAGPSFASDFTVLGDRVNLAARLESANKVTGTRNLVTSRTLKLPGADKFLTRPVARLKVAGRKESALVYEVLCRRADADDRVIRLVAMSTAVFDAYQAGNLERCRSAAEQMRAELGPDASVDRFTQLYLERCELARKPGEPWEGDIELGHK